MVLRRSIVFRGLDLFELLIVVQLLGLRRSSPKKSLELEELRSSKKFAVKIVIVIVIIQHGRWYVAQVAQPPMTNL